MLMLFSPLEMPWTPGHHGYVGVSRMLWAYDTFKTISLISEQHFPEHWKRITCKPEVSRKLASLAQAHHHPFSKEGIETLGK